MQIQDLTKAYQTKTDEELLQLSASSGDLTSEAHAALAGELARRRINVAEQLKVKEDGDEGKIGNSRSREMVFLPNSRRVGEFVAEVLRVYHCHFWFFAKLMAPAVVVGYVAIHTGRKEANEIARQLHRGFGLVGLQTEILKIWLANSAGYVVSWMAFSFSFGAICSGVRQIEEGVVPSVSDSFAAVRERLGSFLRLSLLLLVLLVVGVAAAGLLYLGVLWAFQRQLRTSHFAIQVVWLGFAYGTLLLLSRFGLAMPAIIMDNCRVSQAIFRSDELTEGKWLTLGVLLAKSLVGGYFVGMCPFWLASWIPANVPLPFWFPWALTVASIAGVTVVEPPMFIGFVLLYSRKSAPSAALSDATRFG
jgi:hypothetical protein